MPLYMVMSLPLIYSIAVLSTSFSYIISIYIFERKWKVVGSFLIGITVVTIGYFCEIIGLPMWLIIGIPVPIGIFGLYHLMNQNVRNTAAVYGYVWIFYILFHLVLSGVFHIHSLIPAWEIGGV